VWSFWWWFDILVDFIFLIDIVINFRIGHMEEVGPNLRFIDDPKIIACAYLKFWFWIDLLTSLPVVPAVEAIIDIFEAARLPGATSLGVKLPRLVRIVRIVRLIKLARMMKMSGTMKSWRKVPAYVSDLQELFEISSQILVIAWLCAVRRLCACPVLPSTLPGPACDAASPSPHPSHPSPRAYYSSVCGAGAASYFPILVIRPTSLRHRG